EERRRVIASSVRDRCAQLTLLAQAIARGERPTREGRLEITPVERRRRPWRGRGRREGEAPDASCDASADDLGFLARTARPDRADVSLVRVDHTVKWVAALETVAPFP